MEEKHVFQATMADSKTAASWGEKGRKTTETHPESAFGWVLIGWVLGRSLSFELPEGNPVWYQVHGIAKLVKGRRRPPRTNMMNGRKKLGVQFRGPFFTRELRH